jgi:hypothetical protein
MWAYLALTGRLKRNKNIKTKNNGWLKIKKLYAALSSLAYA